MKTLTMFIFLLGSLASFANQNDPYEDCTKKLENRILKVARRHCFLKGCAVIADTLKVESTMVEEQDPGLRWYVARVGTFKGRYDVINAMFFKMKAYRSSEAQVDEHFFCNLKSIRRISKKSYDQQMRSL